MAGDKSNLTSCYMCSDTATGKDLLGFKPYVKAIAEFLTADETLAPITLSIEGKWGCGKSSFMKQLQEKIENGNICDISIREFLKYIFLNKKKAELPELESFISKLEPLFFSICGKFSQNNVGESSKQNKTFDPYSFKNKIKSIFIYLPSKIKRRKYFTVWFNCWRFEKEDELWAAFALNFMEQLSEQLSWGWRQRAKLKLIWRRLKFKWKNRSSILFHLFLRVIYIVGIFLFWVAILYYSPSLIEWLFSYSTDDNSVRIISNILVVLTASVGFVHYLFSFGKDFFKLLGNPFDFSMFVQNSNYAEHISFIEHFHSDFYKIVESYAGNSKVYVFVDDLDRCEVPKAAELMQALNLMISDKANIYFSIGIDRKVISAGLAAKNEKVLKYLDVKGLEYGYDYIEKFIQLPFKVPSPKDEDFKKFMGLQKQDNRPKKSWISYISYNSLSNYFKKLSSLFKVNHSDLQPDKESAQLERAVDTRSGENIPGDFEEKPENPKPLNNDQDCNEKSKDWNDILENILEMVAPALKRNPRRVKQFSNLFRFQRTIGYMTELFSHDGKTELKYVWNCRKLAKFVVLYMEWPELVSAFGSNIDILNQLQAYALEPKNGNKNLKQWTEDERLINLLRYGCVEGGNPSKEIDKYSLSGLDFSKLLQISPFVPSSFSYSSLLEMEFVPIRAGDFMMGSPDDEVGRFDDEGSVHNVSIKYSFDLGKYPVTQKQWVKVMGSNPYSFKDDGRPVDSVSWDDVQIFIKKLNELEGSDKYRLPSEAEWEYACRAGTTTRYSFGDDESKLGDYAWYDKNSGGGTHPVGQLEHNPWGLYDMHGNVWEWVQDKYHSNYEGAPSDGSSWEYGGGSDRVVRGGGWFNNSRVCRSAIRTGASLATASTALASVF